MVLRHALVLIVLCCCTGCPGIAPPRIFHPGPAAYQQSQAQIWDPYPIVEGGPDIDGRPRAFLVPAPQNERVQNPETFVERYHQPPPPGIYRTPRVSPSLQVVPYTPAPLDPGMAPPFTP